MGFTEPDGPSNPSAFDQVTPHGRGPAAYNIQAPLADGEITAAFNGAIAEGGAGVLYPQGARQAATEQFIQSPQGFGVVNITASEFGGPGEDWPRDTRPA